MVVWVFWGGGGVDLILGGLRMEVGSCGYVEIRMWRDGREEMR